jgi:hypothetical protein
VRRRVGAKQFLQRTLALCSETWRASIGNGSKLQLPANNDSHEHATLRSIAARVPHGLGAWQRASRAARLEIDIAATPPPRASTDHTGYAELYDSAALRGARRIAKRLLAAQPDDLSLFGALAAAEHRFVVTL